MQHTTYKAKVRHTPTLHPYTTQLTRNSIHATLNLEGQGKTYTYTPSMQHSTYKTLHPCNTQLTRPSSFGPGTEWVSGVDYQMSDDAERKSAFVDAIKRYWPDVDAENVSPSYSGIRPKIVGQNEPAADFMIQGPRETGCGMVHLLGIESPGLTSSLAIAEYVVSSLDQPPA
ncbi:hypothetical protein SARC_09867 [Sphaeroforma arctica JP610]|uniref:L-2-hydroxyglutarate dehydrogenase, mitochondrial n=1 Tax=Sphaeroforma arctica JP610 TaxID=667725 RepID=A0A0L0FLP5_9EUKA|nr:hypothetical protein SARC_09867 [Sphaeroforma arctica JP610]KNC77675.1 hypothetical protein SARC_09867 [Sphaeroforma arctica JP610]|eukprot:XP_014151577.1 hypothetical protein SARC_09867 [Sphaeroforma arctica JP610]